MPISLPKGLELPKGLKLPEGLKLPRRGGGGGGGGGPRRVVLLEVDGPAFVATVADVSKSGFQVFECRRITGEQEGDDGRSPVQWLFERGHVDHPVYLLLPGEEARLVETELPRQSGAERKAALQRVARQGCGLEAEVLHAAVKLGKGADKGSARLAVLGVERSGLVADLADNPDLTPGTIMQREQAWSAALPDDLPTRAVVVDGTPECPGLLHVCDGVITDAELLEGEGDDLLRTALPDALKALAGGDDAPQAVVFSPSLGLGADVSHIAAGDLEAVALDQDLTAGLPGWDDDEGATAFTCPGLASLGALRQIAKGGALVEVPFSAAPAAKAAGGGGRALRLPPKKVLIGAGGGLALALVFMLWPSADVKVKVRKKKPPVQDVASVVAPSPPDAAPAAIGVDDPGVPTASASTGSGTPTSGGSVRGQDGLGRRMVASLAVAEACHRVSTGVLLTGLTADREGGLLIEGTVSAASRLDGLQALAAYRASLLTLPFLGSMSESVEYHDDASGVEELGFRLSASWSDEAP